MSAKTRRLLLMLQDAAVIAAAYLIALYARFAGAPLHENLEVFPQVVLATVALNLVLLHLYEAYEDLHRPTPEQLAAWALAGAAATVLAMTVPYVFRLTAFPRSVFALALPVQLALLALARLPWQRRARRRLRSLRVAVAAADGPRGPLAAAAGRALGVERVHELEEPSPEALMRLRPDLLVLGPGLDPGRRADLQATCALEGIRCLIVPTLGDILLARPSVGQLGTFPVFGTRALGLSRDHALVKRLVDVVGAALLLLVTGPLLLLAAAAVKLAEPRAPVLYRQRRVGKDGRAFTLLKLRTMVPDAERLTGPVLAGAHDPRVTPVGRVLRRLRLDELPQLWNVLRGDMSLVGPRPERPEFVAEFAALQPLYALRHAVRPGLTGLAQVLAGYDTDFRDKLRFDLMYVAFASPLLDLKILLLTAKAVLFGGSAAADGPPLPPALRMVAATGSAWESGAPWGGAGNGARPGGAGNGARPRRERGGTAG